MTDYTRVIRATGDPNDGVADSEIYIPLNTSSTVYFSKYTYLGLTAGFAAAVAATPVGGVLDLESVQYTLDNTLQLSKAIYVKNGNLVAGQFPAMNITAAATVWNLTATRSGLAGSSDSLAQRSLITASAPVTIWDATLTDANHALIYLENGLCNGSRIKGKYLRNTVVRRDTCAVYGAAGSNMNYDIRVDGTVIDHGGSSHGIIFFNPQKCIVEDTNIQHCRALAEIIWTTGWTNTSTNVWSRPDRSDGKTTVLLQGGVQLLEYGPGADVNVAVTQTPPANGYSCYTDGNIYVNLGGTDPNTVSLTSRTVSGYGVAFYNQIGSPSRPNDNKVGNSHIEDCDGFGIYYQFTGASTGLRNGTFGKNTLINVCLRGEQNTQLPFAAIGCIGGARYEFGCDTIDGCGTSGTPATGFRPEAYTSDGTNVTQDEAGGHITNMTIIGATKHGAYFRHGAWTANMIVKNATLNGIWIAPTMSTVTLDLTITAICSGNGQHGMAIEKNGFTGAVQYVTIVGGDYTLNGSRGIQLTDARHVTFVKPRVWVNTAAQQVYCSGTSDYCHIDFVVPTLATGKIALQYASTVGNNNSIGVIDVENNGGGTVLSTLAAGQRLRTWGMGAGTPSGFIVMGTPLGNINAVVGSMATRLDGGTGTTLYVKESATDATGWVAK